MKIIEYRILQDDRLHPILDICHVYNWIGKDFLRYENIVDMMNDCFKMNKLNEECIYILAFSYSLELKGVFQLSHGTSKDTTFSNRELFIFLLLVGAEQFVVVHNHVSGILEPSIDDIRVTIQIKICSNILEIKLLKHMIIARSGYKLIEDKMENCL